MFKVCFAIISLSTSAKTTNKRPSVMHRTDHVPIGFFRFIGALFPKQFYKRQVIPKDNKNGGEHFSTDITVKLRLLEHLWNHENIFDAGVARAIEC